MTFLPHTTREHSESHAAATVHVRVKEGGIKEKSLRQNINSLGQTLG